MPGKNTSGGKKKVGGGASLGQALIRGQKREKKNRRAAHKRRQQENETLAALGVDVDNKTTSVTESNSLEDFLTNAVLANRQFDAVRNVAIIDTNDNVVVPEDFTNVADIDVTKMPIPRRPNWDETTTPQELDQAEKLSFLNWRRSLAKAEEENETQTVSPFEKNIEFWRQLWRVVERSDVIVQVVDCRNPLMFRSEDLEVYTKETDPLKKNVLLMNKADYLTEEQRLTWSQFFADKGIGHYFFSAKQEQELLDEIARGESRMLDSIKSMRPKDATVVSSRLINRQELIHNLSNTAKQVQKERTKNNPKLAAFSATVGFSGYPNVGKSSVINVLKGVSVYAHDTQRVSVASTPGHTKHFQTMKLTDDVMLCDSPGLVFPSLFGSKAEMLCNGILPIDEIRGRDFIPAINFVCKRVPRRQIESTYNIRLAMLPSIRMARPEPFLESYCRSRGLLGKSGRLNEAQGARLILKDFVSGKLLFSTPPPGAKVTEPEPVLDQVPETEGEQQAQEDDAEVEAETEAPLVDGQELVDEDALLAAAADEGIFIQPTDEINLDDDVVAAASIDEAVEFMGEQGKLDKFQASRRLKKHGRKHRKGRDKDPYGEKALGLEQEGVVHIRKPY